MANNLKGLDANQVIRSAYDEVNNRLLVDATVSGSIGQFEVVVDHTEDSIALGDGTDLITSTTVGAKIGLDVAVVGQVGSPLDSLDWDAVQVNYPDTVTEEYEFYTGGLAGTLVATATVVYTSSSKASLDTVVWS